MRWPARDAGGRVAARRARRPSCRGRRRSAGCSSACRSCRSSSRSGRSRTRVAQRCAPIGFSGVQRRAELVLLGQRQLRDLGEPARRRRPTRIPPPRASRGRRPSARRGRRAARGSSRRRAASCSAHGRVSTSGASISRRRRGARTRSPPRPAPAIRKPSGCSLLLGQVGEQAGRAREDRHRLHGGGREAEVEHHRGDRHRDVHRQRLAPGLGRRRRGSARASSDVRPAHAALVGELEDPLGARVERPVHRMAEARQPARRRRGSRARHLAGDRRRARRPPPPSPAPPRAAARTPRPCRGSTGPQPRIPAATAPCSDPGSAASVIRAATLVGIIPCSAIATSSRSRK